jgi:hypothetical protein
MHVRLRNGVEIKNLPVSESGYPNLDANIAWLKDGKWAFDPNSPMDIVEVLSEDPKRYLRDMKLEDLKEGMEFMPEGGRIHGGAFCYSVRAFTNGSLVMQYMYVVGKSELAFIDEDLLEELGKLDLYLDGGQ